MALRTPRTFGTNTKEGCKQDSGDTTCPFRSRAHGSSTWLSFPKPASTSAPAIFCGPTAAGRKMSLFLLHPGGSPRPVFFSRGRKKGPAPFPFEATFFNEIWVLPKPFGPQVDLVVETLHHHLAVLTGVSYVEGGPSWAFLGQGGSYQDFWTPRCSALK